MGRYATLNADTKDIVNCLLPGISANFGVTDVIDIIPEEIRMRAWDCDRRKHILHLTEDDPRNWGVQFLKDLVTISRLNNGNLAEFQEKLRVKISNHEDYHPWCRLADIKEIKEDYENPPRPDGEGPGDLGVASSDHSSSEDPYHEELVEPERLSGSKKRSRRRNDEIYEARIQKPSKKSKHGSATKRLRRDSSAAWERPDKSKRRRHGQHSEYRGSPSGRGVSFISSQREDSIGLSVPTYLTPSITASPGVYSISRYRQSNSSFSYSNNNNGYEDLSIQQLEAELAVAEAELKTSRLRLSLIAAKKDRSSVSVDVTSSGFEEEPHTIE